MVLKAHPESRVQAKNFNQVTQFLYRGGLPSANDIYLLKEIGIKTIIDFNRRGTPYEALTAKKLDIRYIHKPWSAYWHNSIVWKYYFNIAEEFLIHVRDKSLWPLYVHCYHGRDRTGMLIAVFRMVYQGWSYRDALAEMRKFGFNRFLHFDLVLFLLRYQRHIGKKKPMDPPHKLGQS